MNSLGEKHPISRKTIRDMDKSLQKGVSPKGTIGRGSLG